MSSSAASESLASPLPASSSEAVAESPGCPGDAVSESLASWCGVASESIESPCAEASQPDRSPSSSAAAPDSEDRPEPSPSAKGASEPRCSASSPAGDSDEDGRCTSPEPAATGKFAPSEGVPGRDGSAGRSASSPGNGSTQPPEYGSGGKPISAATAKGAPSKVVEKFEVEASLALGEHAANHDFPAHVSTCNACRFWKHRKKWSVACSAMNPVTLKKETWLGHAGGGYIVCLFCAARPRSNSEIARGRGSCSRLANLVRHAKCKEHLEAEAAWKERVRAEGSRQGVETFPEAATAAPAAPVVVQKAGLESVGRAAVATRALLETTSPFRSFDVWRDALLGP